ncbi:MAG: hypothetical protein HYR92_00680, partial [Burkholderiales bacterium]|nr:hypothetical protein [Burkholderiales bacterium]
MKKSIKFQSALRPSLIAGLIAASFSASAADRVDLSKFAGAQAKSLMTSSSKAHEFLGLAAGDLKALRSQQFGTKLVTRYEQLHQGVPVWGEAIVEHTDSAQSLVASSARSFHGAMLSGLSQDLPSVRPLYSA